MNEYRAYTDDQGCTVKVSSGISGGKVWMTCRVKPSGSLQRIKSKFLPDRPTRDAAQKDLDSYAFVKGWRISYSERV
jgi:hypothetical protein